ncbi:MAG: hypothetical protein AAF799_42590 [Myxococcota bacterium]
MDEYKASEIIAAHEALSTWASSIWFRVAWNEVTVEDAMEMAVSDASRRGLDCDDIEAAGAFFEPLTPERERRLFSDLISKMDAQALEEAGIESSDEVARQNLLDAARGGWPDVLPNPGRDATTVDGIRWLLEDHVGEGWERGFIAALRELVRCHEHDAVARLADGLLRAHSLVRSPGAERVGDEIKREIWAISSTPAVVALAQVWVEYGDPKTILRWLSVANMPRERASALALLTLRRRLSDTLPGTAENWASCASSGDLQTTLLLWAMEDPRRVGQLREYLKRNPKSELQEAGLRVLSKAGAPEIVHSKPDVTIVSRHEERRSAPPEGAKAGAWKSVTASVREDCHPEWVIRVSGQNPVELDVLDGEGRVLAIRQGDVAVVEQSHGELILVEGFTRTGDAVAISGWYEAEGQIVTFGPGKVGESVAFSVTETGYVSLTIVAGAEDRSRYLFDSTLVLACREGAEEVRVAQ